MKDKKILWAAIFGLFIIAVNTGCLGYKLNVEKPTSQEGGTKLSDLSEKCIFAKESPSYKLAKEAVDAYGKLPKSEKCEVDVYGYKRSHYGIKCIATPQGNVFYESFIVVYNVNTKDSYEYICIGTQSDCMVEGRLDELIAQGFQDIPTGIPTTLAESCD